MITLTTPIDRVARIPSKIVPALKRLRITTLRDLLFHFPSRYDDFSNKKSINDVEVGETVTVQGVIKKISVGRTAKKHLALVEAAVEDITGTLKALWFNQPFLLRTLKVGTPVNLSGKVALGPKGLYLQNPVHEIIPKRAAPGTPDRETHTGGLIAVYPETIGITSRWLRFLVKTYLPCAHGLTDPIPASIRAKHCLPEIKEALQTIHAPESLAAAHTARQRFVFETLLLLQLHALKERTTLKQHAAPVIPADVELIKKFTGSLPFSLTDAQRRCIWEIIQDIARPHPMNRLLEGDVGSGKTVVAAAAALLGAQAGYVTLLMAPTEILAEQHFATLNQVLAPFSVRIGLLTGSKKQAADHHQIIVGTHALLHRQEAARNLGLVVVDEQHRFGVMQRAHLLGQQYTTPASTLPHFLSMSATPIPRTLALTLYGDLDLSLIDELPQSRKKVITRIILPEQRDHAYQFIEDQIKEGRQAFVICPRVDADANRETEVQGQQRMLVAEAKAVVEEHQRLSSNVFPHLGIAMLHGRMKPKEKEAIMAAFKKHETDILVCTSVIEVGVDVPNATVMMIEGAETFGLAQLHQFRGRVGRGEHQSYCLLLPTESGVPTARLQILTQSSNGFDLAQKDLELRGPGELFGTKQSGMPDILQNALLRPDLLETVRSEAVALGRADPTLAKYPELRKALLALEQATHLE